MTTSVESMEVENRYATKNNSSASEGDAIDGAPLAKQENAVVFSTQLLQMYYSRLFPFDMLHQWLSYGKQQIFSHREFSFTIEPVPGEEIYIRYQSFQNKNDLAQAVNKRRPIKIDIGAIFSHPPVDHNTVAADSFKPAARELVFDIDLTDYDEIRRCGCSGANICGVCWGFMTMAVKVMDEGLRDDFGFEHIGWFYSGRRGVHCWVCDESARELTDAGRSAVASYFEVSFEIGS
jgi:DNA primase small subunit